MRIVSAQEMRSVDESAFRRLGIPSFAVMESAGRAVVSVLMRCAPELSHVDVLCGPGNNGGDGYVIGRVLRDLGVDVDLFSTSEPTSKDAILAASAFRASGGTVQSLSTYLPRPDSIVIDALFGFGFGGSGFRGSLDDELSGVSRSIEHARATARVRVLAVDVPSGVDATLGTAALSCITADWTVTFQYPKRGHFLFPAAEKRGELFVVDIGVGEQGEFKESIADIPQIEAFARRSFHVGADAHKGTKGHVFVVGGSEGCYGAPLLSARAALRLGAGLVTIGLSRQAEALLTESLGELMSLVIWDESQDLDARAKLTEFVDRRLGKLSSLVIGPGLGLGDRSATIARAILRIARERDIPTVIDADGLSLIAAREDLWGDLPPRTVLTPHPGEMARLLNTTSEKIQADRFGAARTLSTDRQCWVILKGAHSVVAHPSGECSVVPVSAPALATAGSGDILAGVLGSLLSRSDAFGEDVILGATLHAYAGKRFAEHPVGVVASDLVPTIADVANDLISFEQAVTPDFPVLAIYPAVPS
ncbi:MAG: NAD(P)H-hydrate dehydratase [Deltaproteobacteria bacterium]|nr:NAD(P)H-hydrate dehydratase [Deltaproteobacteria bacterium]